MILAHSWEHLCEFPVVGVLVLSDNWFSICARKNKTKKQKNLNLLSRNFILRDHLRLYGNHNLSPYLNIVVGEFWTLESYAILFCKRSLCEELTKDGVTNSILLLFIYSYGFQSLTNFLRFSIISSLFYCCLWDTLSKPWHVQKHLDCVKSCLI